jgi:hypothetical protein
LSCDKSLPIIFREALFLNFADLDENNLTASEKATIRMIILIKPTPSRQKKYKNPYIKSLLTYTIEHVA